MDLFGDWYRDAEMAEAYDHSAVALATVDADNMPNVRMVLLKAWGEDGYIFYSNRESVKGTELDGNMKAALCFHWKKLARQVRLRGNVELLSSLDTDAYFASRDRGSRIGAWASQQSRPLESRFALEKAVAKYAAKYAIGDVPRPPYWSGFRVKPVYIEFWKDGAFRLHDRVVFRRDGDDDAWSKTRLYP